MKMQIIPDIVNKQTIVALNASSSIHEAVQAMSSHNISAIAITDKNNKLVGIITERDMTHRVLACGLSPTSTSISDIMSTPLETLKPKDNALDAIELMLGRNIRHLPVIDENGSILAMVSMRDLLKATMRNLDINIAHGLEDAFASSLA
ncbi:MAG: CBS domain-containing protein [Magnetovibrio sp.]|nr:CBS domain-containing protein [Magnetovibrio sp.]